MVQRGNCTEKHETRKKNSFRKFIEDNRSLTKQKRKQKKQTPQDENGDIEA